MVLETWSMQLSYTTWCIATHVSPLVPLLHTYNIHFHAITTTYTMHTTYTSKTTTSSLAVSEMNSIPPDTQPSQWYIRDYRSMCVAHDTYTQRNACTSLLDSTTEDHASYHSPMLWLARHIHWHSSRQIYREREDNRCYLSFTTHSQWHPISYVVQLMTP